MLGKIIGIKDSIIYVSLGINIYDTDNLIGKNVVFNDRYIGEINSVVNNMLYISLIGEINNNMFFPGSLNFPPFNSQCRIISSKELDIIYGSNNGYSINIGKSSIYQNYNISLNINSFFSNHFAILGNSGSGKSYFVTKLIQSIFYDNRGTPYNSNIFLFDAFGEYQQAFNNISQYNNNLSYKVITTDLNDNNFEKLLIPFWLLDVDDIALLLNVDDIRQIGILEKALKLVVYFTKSDDEVIKQKNDIIARALLDIVFSVGNHNEVRNKIVSVLSQFNTKDINLDIKLTKGGWTRTFRQCISITDNGNFADIEIIISYLEGFCINDYELILPDGSFMYSIKDFYQALEFALISEGIFSSNKIYDYANILKIRLNAMINNSYVNYFNCDRYITREEYIKYLLYTQDGRKCQLINYNINYVDDRFAKVITKVISKLLFNYSTHLVNRASEAFHIILEEAHRYVQNDIDTKVLGYNIFDRITKEGRKYGILLGVISQRPSELSTTVMSQCSNFAVFKMFYKKDIDFVTDAVANFSNSMINRLKMLSPGSCILFGTAFKIPAITIVDLPNPTPKSDSCNINNVWYGN